MQPFHITLASAGRITLFPEPAELLDAVRVLARVAGPRLLLFSVVDDHLHVVLQSEPESTRHAASGLSRALRAAGAPPLARAHVRPVDGRSHLETLVGYLVRQPVKHGLIAPVATWAGTCAPDLLGARLLPGFDPTAIARALPRVDVPAQVRRVLGVGPLEEVYADHREAWLAAHAAAAVMPGDRSPRGVAARVVWTKFSYFANGLVAERTYRWLRSQTVDPALLAATRRTLALAQVGNNPEHDGSWSEVLPRSEPSARPVRQDRAG